MDPAVLIQQIHAQREQWVTLREAQMAAVGQPARAALRVKLRRPAEAEWRYFFGRTQRGALENVQAYAVDWDGFTEAELLGAGVGASDAVPFDSSVWTVVIADRMAWVPPLFQRLVQMIETHSAAREALEKKSAPSSTQPPVSSTRAKSGPNRTRKSRS